MNQARQLRAQRIDISSGVPAFGLPVVEGKLFSTPDATGYPSSFIGGAGIYDDTDSRIFYSNTNPDWTSTTLSGALNGSVMYNYRDRAYVLFKVIGAAVSITAPKGPLYGTVEVYADGVYQADVDLYSASTVAPKTIFSKTFSGSGQHTVMLVNVYDKAMHGVTNPRIGVDSLTLTP